MWNDLTNYQNSNDQYIAQYGLSGVNAVQSTNFYHGRYALQLSTIKVGSDTLFAYVTNGIQDPIQGMGGIPYSQKPTGISFHYMCNIVAGDTAGVAAIFKRSGAVIGAYVFPITVSEGSYTLYSKTLVPALAQTPDTVIFAAISSLQAMYNNGGGSKGCYPGNTITIDSVNFTGGGITQPPLMNGDFENWTADTMYAPTGWYSEYPGVFQTTDFFAGSYAMQLTTTFSPSNNNPQAGEISTGPFYNGEFNVGGYPYTLTTDTLEFHYKYAPETAGDSGVVYLDFIKNGSSVFSTGVELAPEASYTLDKVGFNFGTTPDTVIVSFSSSKSPNPPMSYVGSVLKVDNVMFKSQPLSVLNLSEVNGIKVYPNPVTNFFYLNTEGFSGSVERVDVYDITGRTVLSVSYNWGLNSSVTSFDMSKTSPGIYIVKVFTSTGVFCQKISKVE